jgi:hypothetical protein
MKTSYGAFFCWHISNANTITHKKGRFRKFLTFLLRPIGQCILHSYPNGFSP